VAAPAAGQVEAKEAVQLLLQAAAAAVLAQCCQLTLVACSLCDALAAAGIAWQ